VSDIDDSGPTSDKPALRRLPSTTDLSREATLARQAQLRATGYAIDAIADLPPGYDPSVLSGSIEGFIGFARMPLGVAGPIRINGSAARGDFFIPLATSEGTLVASFQHAFNAMNRCGGVAALCSHERVGRAPCFEFANLVEAGEFAAWLPGQLRALEEVAASTSRFCRLVEMHVSIMGNTVYVLLEFATGDAAGQNMVTLASQAVCQRILAMMPKAPRSWLVESVLSGDKRASTLAFRSARGRNASAEIVLPARQLGRYWRANPAAFVRSWEQATMGAAQTGSVGLQANVANAIAALFIACGQDVACVAEAVTAATRFELTREGDIYAAITMPNLIVGTVGGGTYLPTAQESLAMLGCVGTGTARKFAEICAVVALAGELSIVGAMASGVFASAHAAGGRKGRTPEASP
jgi:hydroxymethylglutaryl-CoA reductase (NADPH)